MPLCGMSALPSMFQAFLLTVQALAVTVGPSQCIPLAAAVVLMWRSECCPAEAPCCTWTTIPTATLKPLPAGHKRTAWGRCR